MSVVVIFLIVVAKTLDESNLGNSLSGLILRGYCGGREAGVAGV